MATSFPIPDTAAQVGAYFVGQYYPVLEQQPEFLHQFYSDASTMIRIDGNARETATAMLQIHTLIMSFKFTGVEIKTSCSLESWGGGVIVLVSGTVQIKDFNTRKFVQTFFLAPVAKGYFVLNDIFHFIDEEPIYYHPAALLAPRNNVGTIIHEPVSNYFLGGEIQSREFIAPADVKENGLIDNYSFPEQRLQQLPDSKHIMEEKAPEESNGFLQNTVNAVQDHLHASVEEPVVELQRHTYASILQVAKAQAAQVAPPPSANMNAPPVSEWNHALQTATEQSEESLNVFERSGVETVDENSRIEDEGEIKSVYVRNLPCNVTASEIEDEFKKFGKLGPDGVAIRSRKDVYGVCFAFVEFEDMSGVRNAIKAGTVQIADQQLYIEERRPKSNIPYRGRGRGRGGYQTEAARGGVGPRSLGRVGGHDGGEGEYTRFRGNGFHKAGPTRQDKGLSGQQGSRSGSKYMS